MPGSISLAAVSRSPELTKPRRSSPPTTDRLSNGDAARANRFTALVRDVTYLGEDLHLRVLASDHQPLLVSIKNSKGTRAIASGAAIDLAIDPEDIHVLRR